MDVPKKTAPRLFLIDAYALIYRSYFAFLSRPLTNAKGENTSAPFGFANFLFAIRDEYSPDLLAVVFDAGRSHREELFPDYKATREKMPDELRDSLPYIEEMVAGFGDRVVKVDGWEADDVIGTLAVAARERGMEAVIVSGDKDFYQLVGEGIHLLNPGRGGPVGVAADWVDERNASEKFGLPPSQIVDYLALVGDSSDNVPGAPGIGPKTAVKLLKEYSTVESVLDHAEEISGKRARESLLENRDGVLLSKELVTIRTDLVLSDQLGISDSMDELKVSEPDRGRLRELFIELEFRSLLDKLKEPGEESSESAQEVELSYTVLADVEALSDLIEACRRPPEDSDDSASFALQVYTRSGSPTRGSIAGIALSPSLGEGYYLPLGHEAAMSLALGDVEDGRAPNLPGLSDEALRPLRELLEDPSVGKIGYDLKTSVISLARAGIDLGGPLFDAMIASYVLDPGRRTQELGALASDFLGFETMALSKVLGTGKKRQAFGDLPAHSVAEYACQGVDVALRLWTRFAGTMEEQGLRHLYDELEAPVIRVLATMERNGVAISAEFFAEMSRRLEVDLGKIRKTIFEAAGKEFNINSTPQLREILFDDLDLPVIKRTKTGPSTDSSVLEELAEMGHELPGLLMEYRQLEKLRSTYVDALPSLVNPETRRIHTTFNQAVAATGRLSSSDPNLQNIPIRTELGREIRRGFVAPEGWRLLAADYSQIELRILAHFSGDDVFVEAFKNDEDVHRATAAVIFDVPRDEVDPVMRGQAKTVNFATLYGQGSFSLGRQLGISREEANTFIEQYFERFSGVRAYLDEQVETAKKLGYVETLMGRRRYVPELRAKNWNMRQFGERVAQNTPIQGTAADMIKVAMIQVHENVAHLPWVRMLLQVHDELVFEVEEERVDELQDIVVRLMESAMDLAVPLRVDVGVGQTWYDCKD